MMCLRDVERAMCARCESKGAGVLTTRQRYSRKTHRQTKTYHFLPFSDTILLPGVLTTLKSNMYYRLM